MDSAKITYKGLDPSGLGGVTIFLTVNALGRTLMVQLQGSFELSYDTQFQNDKNRFNDAIFREGMTRLRVEIDAQGLDAFMSQQNPHRILLSTENVPRELPLHKQCVYQERTARALVCKVAEPSESKMLTLRPPETTTVPVCDECHHPDDRRRCTELIGVWTLAHRAPTGFARAAAGICAIGNPVQPNGLGTGTADPKAEEHDISRCRLGQRECARIDWVFDEPAPISEGVGIRVLREIDYLNLVTKQELGFEPISLPDAEVVGLFMTDATNAEELTVRIAAAATILEKMAWPRVPQGGSLNALEAHLKFVGAGVEPRQIRHLRAIVDMRHGPPVHDAADRAARGAATLGLAYPVGDHKRAWQQIRQALADSLHHLAVQIKQRAPAPGDVDMTS